MAAPKPNQGPKPKGETNFTKTPHPTASKTPAKTPNPNPNYKPPIGKN